MHAHTVEELSNADASASRPRCLPASPASPELEFSEGALPDDNEEEEEEKRQQHLPPRLDCYGPGRSSHRLRWTHALHAVFLRGVALSGGLGTTTAKAVLLHMQQETGGVTLLQVQNHLQKYRRFGKKGEQPTVPALRWVKHCRSEGDSTLTHQQQQRLAQPGSRPDLDIGRALNPHPDPHRHPLPGPQGNPLRRNGNPGPQGNPFPGPHGNPLPGPLGQPRHYRLHPGPRVHPHHQLHSSNSSLTPAGADADLCAAQLRAHAPGQGDGQPGQALPSLEPQALQAPMWRCPPEPDTHLLTSIQRLAQESVQESVRGSAQGSVRAGASAMSTGFASGPGFMDPDHGLGMCGFGAGAAPQREAAGSGDSQVHRHFAPSCEAVRPGSIGFLNPRGPNGLAGSALKRQWRGQQPALHNNPGAVLGAAAGEVQVHVGQVHVPDVDLQGLGYPGSAAAATIPYAHSMPELGVLQQRLQQRQQQQGHACVRPSPLGRPQSPVWVRSSCPCCRRCASTSWLACQAAAALPEGPMGTDSAHQQVRDLVPRPCSETAASTPWAAAGPLWGSRPEWVPPEVPEGDEGVDWLAPRGWAVVPPLQDQREAGRQLPQHLPHAQHRPPVVSLQLEEHGLSCAEGSLGRLSGQHNPLQYPRGTTHMEGDTEPDCWGDDEAAMWGAMLSNFPEEDAVHMHAAHMSGTTMNPDPVSYWLGHASREQSQTGWSRQDLPLQPPGALAHSLPLGGHLDGFAGLHGPRMGHACTEQWGSAIPGARGSG